MRPDDEDDSLAANPEGPRGDLGYEVATEPRRRRKSAAATYFTIAEREVCRPEERGGRIGGGPHTCRCGAETATLHADPDSTDPRRVLCPKCTGDAMRRRL